MVDCNLVVVALAVDIGVVDIVAADIVVALFVADIVVALLVADTRAVEPLVALLQQSQ